MTIDTARFRSPVGELTLAARDTRVVAICFEGTWESRRERLAARFPGDAFREARDPAGTIAKLRRYFDGDLGALLDVDVDTGGTPFQQRVWTALRNIEAGSTRSYAAIAAAAGAPTAVRATGAANGANPVVIVVPCHRVIGSDGSLTGFGGGLPRKKWLLAHESAQAGLFARAVRGAA